MKLTKTEKAVSLLTLAIVIFTFWTHLSFRNSQPDFTISTLREPAADAASLFRNTDLININTADKDELMELDGIGEKLAERIIEYRSENGDFESASDITRVSGIGDGIFSKICGFITVK